MRTPTRNAESPQLACRGIEVSLGGRQVLSGVNLTLRPGQITAVIGPNGSGKTTLFHVLTGFLKPCGGSVLLGAQQLANQAPWYIAQAGVGRLFQDVRLFGAMTVIENVMMGFRAHPGHQAWRCWLAPRLVSRIEREFRQLATTHLAEFGLAGLLHHPVAELSFGQQKLVALARLLAGSPRVLLLDEPTSGLHDSLMPNLLAALRRATADQCAVAVIEHNFPFVSSSADWVYFLDDGRITVEGSPARVLADERVVAGIAGVGEV